MSGTLQLGSIPSLSVWQGETLTFRVTSKIGSDARFSQRTAPTPSGKISLAPDGAFEYTPATADREEITITIRAQRDSAADEQSFVITPRPRLAPEFKHIRHLTDLPERSDPLYNIFSEEDAGKAVFNNTVDFLDKDAEKVKVDTKNIAISGVEIILEAQNSIHTYFDALDDRTDVRRLTICADQVIIRSPLRLPGTDVFIYARILTFEGGPDGGSINTTPRAVTMRSQDRDEALKGQKAGDVHLYAGKIDIPDRSIRIIANGADGQPARLGLKPKPATSISKWDGKAVTTTWGAGHEELNWAPDFHTLGGYTPIYAHIWQYYPAFFPKPWQYQFDKGTKDKWPSDGNPPEKYPGRPGQGGDSGSISVGKFEWIEGLYSRRPGVPGAMAEDIPACPAGEPRKSCRVRADYESFMIPSTDKMVDGDGIANRKRGVRIMDDNGRPLKRETKDGPAAPAPPPNPDTPFGREGKMTFLTQEKSWFWLHKASIRALIPYIHDAMLAGHAQTTEVRDLLVTYCINTAIAARETPADRNNPQKLGWSALNSELTGLLQRIDSPYDYYGNPAGWVPMLSFQANLSLFDSETEDALRILFLTYWLEKTEKKKQKATKTLTAVIDSLRKETTQAEKDYEAANAKIVGLEAECKEIASDITKLETEVLNFERDLRHLVGEDLRREHILRGGAKILGGIMQLVPVGQPVLGAFGKAGVALADIDLDKPMSAAPGVVKAFAPLVQKKVSEKVSSLMAKTKEGKTSVKKETDKEKEFKEAVAEAELEEKVEKHLEEQKEIKNGIIEAFSGIAVKDSEVDERLAQVMADCPELQDKIKKLKELNAKKAVFVEQLLAALQTIDEATAVMLMNQLAIIKMRGQRDELILNLSNLVLQYAQAMGERARQRLLKYQYYLLKSYQYLMLRDTSGLDFRAIKLFTQFADFVAVSENGTLTDVQLKTLKTVFREQVKDDILKVIDMYQGNAPSLGGSFDVSLSDEELATLNTSSDNRLEIDLMQRGGLSLLADNMRITKIEATTVELAKPPERGAVTVNLEFFHDGNSRLRRFGQLFLFRSGDYSVAPSGGAGNERGAGQTAHRLWGSIVKYEEGRQKIENMIPDPAADSLLRHLLGADNQSKEAALYFRPAAWSGLQIRLSVVPTGSKGALKKLTFSVSYVSDAVPDNLSSVLVRQFNDTNVLVWCSAIDLNGCNDGQGTFLRTFNKNASPKVTLKVPPRCAGRAFLHWRRIAGEAEDFIAQPAIELDLKKTSAYTLEPIYAKEVTRIQDSIAASWPKCPADWQSIDWFVVNNSGETIRVMEVDAFPFQAPTVKPVPDKPEGNNIIRLSFQQVEIPAGGKVRMSACINPKDPDYPSHYLQHRSYWEKAGGKNYTIYFNARGELESRRKDYDSRSANDEIGLDAENRTLTFL